MLAAKINCLLYILTVQSLTVASTERILDKRADVFIH
jgi:hypothetical protein